MTVAVQQEKLATFWSKLTKQPPNRTPHTKMPVLGEEIDLNTPENKVGH